MKRGLRSLRVGNVSRKLRDEFDELYAQMQGKSRAFLEAFNASPEQLGKAAVEAARKDAAARTVRRRPRK